MTVTPERTRLKFVDFDFSILPSGRCRSRVVLGWKDGVAYEGAADGIASQTGELRCAAEATVKALEQAVEGKVKLELLGVKAVRAFDAVVVIVSLSCHNGSAQRVVGSYLSEDELPRGAALAVLNATNRLLGNIVFTR
ncbi:MAG: hypothetical protein JSW71_16810 [Gemmatimonadota bacterium]|nr:MAG: hypothetical protein JSW71_16810 [Gemmatimonadota bacterium]